MPWEALHFFYHKVVLVSKLLTLLIAGHFWFVQLSFKLIDSQYYLVKMSYHGNISGSVMVFWQFSTSTYLF